MSVQRTQPRIPYFGDFVLFDEIGRGGMGVVYNAQQSKLDRPVALKVLHSGLTAGETGIQRFRIEAEAAARLSHPNIVPIFEFGEHAGQPYLAMQLIEGENLAEHIARRGPEISERKAASVVAKLARAVHHAHQRGVLHRDLKPGNVLLDERGEPHLIDFGIAKCIEQDSGMTQTGALLCTPSFAAPEQVAGQHKSVTTAADIYSLGAILYMLLTGEPPFVGESHAETIRKVMREAPRRVRLLNPRVSKNLEVICLKCLEKEPARRYGTALALAEDLECFLDGRVIAARPAGLFERLWLWMRRHPAYAALWATGLMVVSLLLGGTFAWREARTREAEARVRIFRQRQLLYEIQQIRSAERSAGWSTQAWQLAVEAGKTPNAIRSSDVRNEAAALLGGLDARRVRRFTTFNVSSVLFDRGGKRLLIGGTGDGAQLWNQANDSVQSVGGSGLGPVAFTESGAAARLLYDTNTHALILSDLANSAVIHEWKIPAVIEEHARPAVRPNLTVLATHGESGAVIFSNKLGRQLILHFNPKSTRLIDDSPAPITALAISAGGDVIAAANSAGRVKVWDAGDGELMAEFLASRNEILSLTLRPSLRVVEASKTSDDSWILAAGDSGGRVSIWDVRTKTASAFCRGGHYQIYALAFSPDGMTLASGGRGPVKIWDAATGKHLLDVWSGDFVTDLNFSADGRHLAISCQSDGGQPVPNVTIWELEFQRGLHALHGLSGQISKICFSNDGQKLAALSHTWEVGLWDANAGHLMRVIEVPRGEFADNAALAFSPDGERLAFSAARWAGMWRTSNGQALASWELPPGFVDVLRFPAEDRLALFRVETADGQRAPFSNAHPRDHPRVCRIRNLLAEDWRKPQVEIHDFNWHVFSAQAPADGRCFVVDGLHVEGKERTQMTKCFNAVTGQEIWMLRSARNNSGTQCCDAKGTLVSFQPNRSSRTDLVHLETGSVETSLFGPVSAFRAEPRLYVITDPTAASGISLFSDRNQPALLVLRVGALGSAAVLFDQAGWRLGWGSDDGTVYVCDLKETERRLLKAGLHWKAN